MPLFVPYNIKPTEVNPVPTANYVPVYDDHAPLFLGKPNLSDIAQGTIGDCFFLSSLLAMLHRPNGDQIIDNMMVEDTVKKSVTVRLYEAPGKPIYLRTRKCRVKNVGTDAPVSSRACCWPDVLEACASIFSMKTALDTPVKSASPSLDNLHYAAPRHALTILTGKEVGATEIPDVRELDINKNLGYGFLQVLLDRKLAPDPVFRDDCVQEGFGAAARTWDSWAASNKTALDDFLKGEARFASGKLSMTTKRLDEFLKAKVPAHFHAGLRAIADRYRFIQGKGLEAKYLEVQDQYFDHLTTLVSGGCPVVLGSRDKVTFAPGGSTTAPLGEDQYKGMLGSHCYALEHTRTHSQSGRKWLLITNPWGRYVRAYDNITGKAIEVENINMMGGGRFCITLHDLFKKFEYYTYCLTKL